MRMFKKLNFFNAFLKIKLLSERWTLVTNLRRYKLRFSHPFFPFIKFLVPLIKLFTSNVPPFFLSAIYSGNAVKCLCCGWAGKKFLISGDSERKCPNCGAIERDRLMYLFLQSRYDFFHRKLKILDIGPSIFIQDHLSSFKSFDYISIDLYNRLMIVQMDVTKMTFPDTNFDIILCSNVLEHIKNDVKAISEIYRVLKPGGFALILVPIGGEKTFEDSTIPPEKYAEYYGCAHHVRLYGLDIKEKLTLLGFKVKIEYFGNNLSQNFIEKYGLNKNEIFFIALK